MSVPVEILRRREPPAVEAIIDRVDPAPDCDVDVRLTLARGGTAVARLPRFDLSWLEVGVGDIVWVRPAGCAA